MANEEQRRAYASYMGIIGAGSQNLGQSSVQFSGAVANPYLFNQLPGTVAPPTAPTPPPAPTSSVISYPISQNGQNHGNIFQRPPPLGQAEAFQVPQHTSHPAKPPGYVQVPRHYEAQPPPAFGYNDAWPYTNPMAEQHRRLSGAPAAEIIESQSKRMNEQSHYRRYEHAHAVSTRHAPPQNTEELSVPVMLCHTCSHCSRIRSVGFHRNNPVLPGQPLVSQACRRCEKRFRSQCCSSYTRIRSCTADVPCDWPRESIHFDVDRSEHRGRRQYRDELYVTQSSPDRRHVIQRSSSQMHLGLGALQQPPRRVKTETRVRTSSLSPRHCSRYDEVWPPPDVVITRPSRSSDVFSSEAQPISCSTKKESEVWPPPDAIYSHSYRKADKTHPRLSRVSSRIIELSPSPSPPQSRARKEKHRNESQERRSRSRSLSPIQLRVGKTRRSESAEARITAHPRPYRPVLPDRRNFHRGSDANSSDNGSMASRRPSSSNTGILKVQGRDYETPYRRRTSMRDSQQSIAVEVGGPRVQFSTGVREGSPMPEFRDRTRRPDEQYPNSENYKQYHGYSRHRYVEPQTSLATPIKEFEELRFRHISPLTGKQKEGKDCVDRSRRLSSSPSPTRLDVDKASSHRTSRVTLSPERPSRSGYRRISRTGTWDHAATLTAPLSRRREREDGSADMTDSESAASGGITEVRSWKGVDGHGQPATFVEEKRTVKMLEPERERGANSRPLNERLTSKSWRDV